MKAILASSIVAACTFSAAVRAQFTVVGTNPSPVIQITSLGVGIRFITVFPITSASGQRTIYNLDYSVHRVLNYPAPPAGMSWNWMGYVTEELFDTDPSTIEFAMLASSTGQQSSALYVFREDGSELFVQSPGFMIGQLGAFYVDSEPIFTVDGQTYMSVHQGLNQGPMTLYALPGSLPCKDCFGSPHPAITTGVGEQMTPSDPDIRMFPNPAGDSVTLVFGTLQVDFISIWDAGGRLVHKERAASGGAHTITISELPVGTYTVDCIDHGLRIASLPLVVQR